jgi:hypothetical protein
MAEQPHNLIIVSVGSVFIQLPEEEWSYPICIDFLKNMQKEFKSIKRV